MQGVGCAAREPYRRTVMSRTGARNAADEVSEKSFNERGTGGGPYNALASQQSPTHADARL